MTQYCKVKDGIPEYGGWIGVVNALVSDTKAQGRAYSVVISPDPETVPAIEVFLPEGWLLFFKD